MIAAHILALLPEGIENAPEPFHNPKNDWMYAESCQQYDEKLMECKGGSHEVNLSLPEY